MVKARQMKDSVQRQNLDFLGGRMSQQKPHSAAQCRRRSQPRPPASPLRRGSEMLARSCRKRQHIRCLVLPAKLAIQRAHGRTAGHQHIHLALAAQRPAARAARNRSKRAFAQSCDLSFAKSPTRLTPSAAFLRFLRVYLSEVTASRSISRGQNKQEGLPRALPPRRPQTRPALYPLGFGRRRLAARLVSN